MKFFHEKSLFILNGYDITWISAIYSHTATLSNSLSHFINNLEQKNQTEQQIENRGIANLGPQIYADLRIAGLCL